MFLVDDTLDTRQDKIKKYIESDIVVALLLASADFEWTVRRAILALGSSPTKIIRKEVLIKCHGLDDYKSAWKKEIKQYLDKDKYRNLVEVVPDWNFFKTEAYPLRHKLIHGVIGATGNKYTLKRVESILNASKHIAIYASDQNEPIFGRKIVRIKRR